MLLRKIKQNGIGTNDVECILKKLPLSENALGKLRLKIMNAKIKDAYKVKQTKSIENFRVWRRSRRLIPGHLLQGYMHIWRMYTDEFKQIVDRRHDQKLKHLIERWKKILIVPDMVRGVSLEPDMSSLPPEFSSEPRLYGGVKLDEDEKIVLECPVKFGLYKKLNTTQCKIDVEEALNKLRWSKIISEKNKSRNMQTEEQEGNPDTDHIDRSEFISDDKVVDINQLRATDLPYNPTVKMPWSIGQQELDIHMFKRDVQELAEKMKNNTKKWSNLDDARQRGLKKLRSRVAQKEIVCFETDKSGRWSVDTPANYERACRSHLADPDKIMEISIEEHDKAEKQMNAEGLALLQMLGLDPSTSGDRLRHAVVVHGTKIPPLYGTRKDHKEVQPGMEQAGPKVRPVCGAEDCITKRLSYILCLLGSHLLEGEETHCDSTIGMLEDIESLNRSGKVTSTTVIGSLDVDALYPSLDIKKCARVFRDKLFHSTLSFPGLSWKDIALYLAMHMNKREIKREGIERYIPVKRRKRGRPPTLTASGTSQDKAVKFGPWRFKQVPDEVTIRLLFCIAIECMIKVTMALHDFQFNGTVYRQRSGGSIGLDLTGIISDVYMCFWDKELLKKCEEQTIDIQLYRRYKDDVNLAIDPSEAVSIPVKDDISVMKKMKELADSIDPSLTVSTDCSSNHIDGKTPVLDIRVWTQYVDGKGWKILHCHYIKEVSTRKVMHQESSHGERMKFHVMINEMDRIMRNTSPYLLFEDSLKPSLEYFVKRMRYSGYSKLFIHDTIVKAFEKFDVRIDRHSEGKSYYNLEELTNRVKGKEWYKENGKFEAVMFVEATPKSEYLRNVKKLVTKHKLKIKVVEKAGQTIKQVLQRSDPYQNNTCNRDNCFVCANDIPINCRERGIVYELRCTVCQNRKYRGQTGRSEFERVGEHFEGLEGEDPSTPLFRHKELYHPDEEFSVEVKVLAKCFGKPSRRMITEAVLIDELGADETMNNKSEWTYTKLYKL